MLETRQSEIDPPSITALRLAEGHSSWAPGTIGQARRLVLLTRNAIVRQLVYNVKDIGARGFRAGYFLSEFTEMVTFFRRNT